MTANAAVHTQPDAVNRVQLSGVLSERESLRYTLQSAALFMPFAYLLHGEGPAVRLLASRPMRQPTAARTWPLMLKPIAR